MMGVGASIAVSLPVCRCPRRLVLLLFRLQTPESRTPEAPSGRARRPGAVAPRRASYNSAPSSRTLGQRGGQGWSIGAGEWGGQRTASRRWDLAACAGAHRAAAGRRSPKFLFLRDFSLPMRNCKSLWCTPMPHNPKT